MSEVRDVQDVLYYIIREERSKALCLPLSRHVLPDTRGDSTNISDLKDLESSLRATNNRPLSDMSNNESRIFFIKYFWVPLFLLLKCSDFLEERNVNFDFHWHVNLLLNLVTDSRMNSYLYFLLDTYFLTPEELSSLSIWAVDQSFRIVSENWIYIHELQKKFSSVTDFKFSFCVYYVRLGK